MGNPFRETAALDGHTLGSVFDFSKAIKPKKKYKARFEGDSIGIAQRNKLKKKIKDNADKAKKDVRFYNKTYPYVQAFRKLEKVTIDLDGKKIKAMDLFFEKCIDGDLFHSDEIEHFDPTRALVEKWIKNVLLKVKVNYYATLELQHPVDEKKLLQEQIAEAEQAAKEALESI